MMDETSLKKLLNNKNILKSVNAVPVNFTMATVLEGMVEKQIKDKEIRASLTKALDKVDGDEVRLSDRFLREKLVEFNSAAMKGFQRIASTLVGITRGEMEGLALNSIRGADFSDQPNKPLLSEENKLPLQEYIHQISDTGRGLKFLTLEIETVSKDVGEKAKAISEELEKGSTMFNASSQNLVEATKGYLDVLTDDVELIDSADKSLIVAGTEIQQPDTRFWISHIMNAMSDFGHFLAKFAEAEVDLNKINQIDATGILRSALTTHIGNMMTFDQRMYPDNNQVPIPPNNLPPAIVTMYMIAYKDRATDLARAGPEGIPSINNKFDRQIANAHNSVDRISPTLLIPKPATLARQSQQFIGEVIPPTRLDRARGYAGGAKDLLTDSAKLSFGAVKELGTGAFQEGKALFSSANAGIDKLSQIGVQRGVEKRLKKDTKRLERQRARLEIQNQQSLAIAEAVRTNMELEERNRILEEALSMANQP
jgi:hypothetical protein